MFGRMKTWALSTGLFCASVCAASATEPFVQDFDGWKITIRPGASRLPDPLPPSPGPIRPEVAVPAAQGSIHLAAFRQQGTTSAHEQPSVPAKATPAAVDGLPVIIPGESDWCCDSKPVVMPPEGAVDPRYLSQMYAEIYKSLPFIRAEYDANPSYLHDTAVEFLFGKMRPTVVHRGTTVIRHDYPYGYGIPYAYGGFGYAYPPLQLVVPGTGLRIHRLN